MLKSSRVLAGSGLPVGEALEGDGGMGRALVWGARG